MEFRIVELNDAKTNKKLFFVQIGNIVWEKWFLCFSRRKTVWEWFKDKPQDTEAVSFTTFAYALEQVEELKKQLPIYYRIK